MQISLYNCTSETNRVNKSSYLSNRFVLDGYLKEKTSMQNPVIVIKKPTNPIVYAYNYMYIGEFERYYYITDIVNVSRNMWEIHGRVDVLFSFASDIRATSCIIDKCANGANANVYMNDGSFVMDSRKYNELKEFPTGLNTDGQYILICAGGT